MLLLFPSTISVCAFLCKRLRYEGQSGFLCRLNDEPHIPIHLSDYILPEPGPESEQNRPLEQIIENPQSEVDSKHTQTTHKHP